METNSAGIGDDWLEGAEAIAAWWLGNPGRRRTIYYWASLRRYPFLIRIGARICARKSHIEAFLNGLENPTGTKH